MPSFSLGTFEAFRLTEPKPEGDGSVQKNLPCVLASMNMFQSIVNETSRTLTDEYYLDDITEVQTRD